MVTFLSLPNKLKLQIIEIAAPDDIENFALCCKIVHDLARETLRQHKGDKERYSRLHFSLLWDMKDQALGTLGDSYLIVRSGNDTFKDLESPYIALHSNTAIGNTPLMTVSMRPDWWKLVREMSDTPLF